ncbi:MAG: PAS domain S-box protein [Deltaproteobacteria bacterium]|nr:PAS domain S-box protein [Deltaproteobacteria bacterium]
MKPQEEILEQLSRQLEECRKRFEELEADQAEFWATKGELRDSEKRLRAVAQTAIDAIVSIDTQDRIIFWNKAAERMFGYSDQEALGKPVGTIIPDSHKQAHLNGVKRYLETGEPALIGRTMELPALRKDGTEFPIELSLATWKARGETFFTGIIRDITERKEAEKQLQLRTEEAKRRKECCFSQ